MRIFIYMLLGFFTTQPLFSQHIKDYDLEMQKKHAALKGYDPSYRVNYFENIILRSEFISDIPRAELVNGATGETFEIRSASEFQQGFSLDYKWVAIGFSFTPKFLLTDQNLKELGDSKSYSFELNFFYSDRWRQELRYNYYEGFYSNSSVSNKENFDVLLKNTVLQNVEGSTFFIVNPNFSFRSYYAQTESQLKSAGSLIPRLGYKYSVIKTNFDNESDIDLIKSLDVIAQVGYLYTFVFKQNWLVSAGVRPGLGYNYSRYKYYNSESGKQLFNAISFAFDSELNFGYNSYRCFFGTTYKLKNYNYSNSVNDEFNRSTGSFNVYLGYRFNDNKPMRKFFGWFEDKLGF